MAKAVCGGDLDGFCKGLGGLRPCPDHERVILAGAPPPKADKGKGG
jgi:hypothetical protein